MEDVVSITNRQPRLKRREYGKFHRASLARSAHAHWTKSDKRPDFIKLLNRSNADRLPDLIPIRHQRMLQSPLACFRGLAMAMTYDLANMPSTGMAIQICGDCHLQNFGWFGTPERNVIFDITDFDETFAAPWEWDLKRLAVSFVLAAANIGASKSAQLDVARLVVEQYRGHLQKFELHSPLEMCYRKLDASSILKHFETPETTLRITRMFEKARLRTVDLLLPKLVQRVDERLSIIDQPPMLFHPQDKDKYLREVKNLLSQYRETLAADRQSLLDRYELVDAAYKVVGVGSVGLRCGLMLCTDSDSTPLLLQLKEARASVLQEFIGTTSTTHQGSRVVGGQRLMQAASDMFLGWATDSDGRQYYVRQLRDMKLSVDVGLFSKVELEDYAKLCGWAIARAHSKSGDAASILGYIGESDRFETAMSQFAMSYVDQVYMDFEYLKKAAKSGKISVA